MLPIEASDNYKAHHERPSSDEPDMDEPEVERRPRKRRKKDLSKLPDMPLDILFEIFGNLHPLDLLRLARTTKALRDILMSRSSITIWREARNNVEGLPDCPADLSEAAYANLAFDPHCHYCLDARVNLVFWACRVRCCKNCFKYEFLDWSGTQWFDALEGLDLQKVLPSILRSDKYWYRRDQIVQLTNIIEDFPAGEEEAMAFYNSRVAWVKEMQDSEVALTAWQEDQSQQRSQELDDLRLQRRKQIMERLAECGLADEVGLMDDDNFEAFITQSWMKQPKALTTRTWNNIKDSVIEYVLEVQSYRIANERLRVPSDRIETIAGILDQYARTRPNTEYLPSLPDICVSPEFIRWLTIEAPQIVGFTSIGIMQKLPEICTHWRKTASFELLEIMGPSEKTAPGYNEADELKRLELATTFFKCVTECCYHGTIAYPRILVHPCAAPLSTFFNKPNSDVYDVLNALDVLGLRFPWNFSRDTIEFDWVAWDAAREIVTLCGGDPEKTTTVQMDALDRRLACKQCKTAMNWRKAVYHSLSYTHTHSYRDVEPAQWRVLDQDRTDLVLQKEAERSEQTKRCWAKWCCTRCRTISGGRRMDWGSLKLHLVHDHGVEEGLRKGRDYYMHLDIESSEMDGPDEVHFQSRHK